MNKHWFFMGTRARWLALGGWASLFKGRTLSRRILVPVLPLVIAVPVLMGAMSYALVRHQIVETGRRFIVTEAQNASHAVEAFFFQRLTDLDSLAETPLLSGYNRSRRQGRLREAEAYRADLARVFAGISARSKVYYDMAYVGADGRRVAALRPADGFERDGALEISALLKSLRRDRVVGSPLRRAEDGGPVVQRIAKPVYAEGAFAGALVADVDMTAVENILRSVEAERRARAALLDGSGRHLLGAAVRGGRGYLQGSAPVRSGSVGGDWTLAVEAPVKEFLRQPLARLMGATLLFSFLAALLLMLIIVSRVSDLMEPIHVMVEGTKRFSAGDLTFRFAHLKTVELDGLASSFNRMAETLETRNRELEQKLRQLTSLRDLEEAVIQRQDEELVLRTCLEAVARGFAFDRTGLYWVDAAHEEIVGRYLYGSEAAGFSEASFRRRRVSFHTEDILNEVARNRVSVLIRKPDDDPRVDPGFVMEAKTREFCMAPICGKDRVLGIITADNFYTNRSIQEADREGLMLFANAVGLALENAMLFQNLAESESKLRTVLENSPEAIVGLSREHWIGTWNRGAEKIFGLSAAEALGKPLTILFPKTAGNEFKRLLNQVIEKGSVRDFAMPGQTKDGRPLDLSVSWGGHHQDFWMNKEWTLVVRDITESRRLQQQLIRSEKLSAVGQLISGIAHELNNPLQAVVGYSDILSDDLRQKAETAAGDAIAVKPQEIMDDLRIITDNAMRCQKIIENLLLFVRQGEIEKKPVDLDKVVQASRDLLQYKLKKAANVHVEVESPALLPKARGNFQQLEQVFVNLINNACDAMGAGPQRKHIRISLRETAAGLLRVELADNGPGVPEALRGRLFEPFFTTKGEGRGTGLGLAVCRQIIEDHGGKIGFTSEENQGTTFWIELPIAKEEPASLQSSAAVQPLVKGKSLLIVDDEPDVLGFLTKVILATGNHVEVAGSLKDAIQKSAERPYDLVLTDVRLGEGTGFSLYENWSLWTRHPRPGFLFMTGDVLNGTVIEDIEKRGLHMLHKPLDLATFQNTLNKALAAPANPGTPSNKPVKNAPEGTDRLASG